MVCISGGGAYGVGVGGEVVVGGVRRGLLNAGGGARENAGRGAAAGRCERRRGGAEAIARYEWCRGVDLGGGTAVSELVSTVPERIT